MLTADPSGTTAKKKPPTYTADQVAASLAANPQASKGGYEGPAQAWDPPQTTGGGSSPFDTNPGYLAALAAEQAGSQDADAALRAAQEAAIVGYGDPSIAAALGINVAPNTAAAARANYLAGNSSLARLDRQKGNQESQSINNLAAHGILFSGETGYQRGEIGRNYGNAVYDTQQQLLSGLNAAGQQTNQTKQGLHSQTIGALMGAYDTAVANPGLYSAAGSSTAPPPPTDPVGSSLGAPPLAAAGAGARTAKSRLAAKPMVNPYTTGQKRFG